MLRLRHILLALVLPALAAGPPFLHPPAFAGGPEAGEVEPPRPEAGATVAREGAGDSFEVYLEGGARGHFVLDGAALTRYVSRRYGSQVPDGIRSWGISLIGSTAILEGVADLGRYFSGLGMEVPAALGSFGGEIPFAIEGSLQGAAGRGRFIIQAIRFAGVSVPLELVQSIADSCPGAEKERAAGRSILIQEFALPPGVERAILSESRVKVNG